MKRELSPDDIAELDNLVDRAAETGHRITRAEALSVVLFVMQLSPQPVATEDIALDVPGMAPEVAVELASIAEHIRAGARPHTLVSASRQELALNRQRSQHDVVKQLVDEAWGHVQPEGGAP